jgi:hypothetical protein
MPSDNEQRNGVLLNIWQVITLVGDVRQRSDEIDGSELETVLAQAESLLIGVVSQASQRLGGPTRQGRGLRFWKTAHDAPSARVSSSGATSVIPFPGAVISQIPPSFTFAESAPARTGTTGAESFAAINSATWHHVTLVLVSLLGSIGIAWAGRNLVLGNAKGVDQHSAGHRQFIRQHAARLAKLFKLTAIRPANEASFIVRQSPAELSTRGLRVVPGRRN